MCMLWFRLESLIKTWIFLCVGNEGEQHGIAGNRLAVLLLLLLHSEQNSLLWCSKSVWMLCWGTWFSGNHWWRANGWTGWSCGSFSTLAILWFYDSLPGVEYLCRYSKYVMLSLLYLKKKSTGSFSFVLELC